MNTSIQAKTFRREMRWAEKLLWHHLRNRKMAGFKFRRQYSLRPYVLDFFCYESKLAIEIDGRQHGEPKARAHDAKRDMYLKMHGIRIKRIWNFQLRENLDGVLAGIRMAFEELKESPHLGPLPRERGSFVKKKKNEANQTDNVLLRRAGYRTISWRGHPHRIKICLHRRDHT